MEVRISCVGSQRRITLRRTFFRGLCAASAGSERDTPAAHLNEEDFLKIQRGESVEDKVELFVLAAAGVDNSRKRTIKPGSIIAHVATDTN